MPRKSSQPPEDGADTIRTLIERAQFIAADLGIRTEIVGSWRRSADAGLRPDAFEVPYDDDIDGSGRLAWAARPVLERMGADLDGANVGLLLTDEHGRVLDRQAPDRGALRLLDEIRLAPGFVYDENLVGTNAIGTALRRHGPTLVQAQEHFADALTHMACAATPITDPRTGLVIGVVDLSCTATRLNPLMLPLVKRAAWEIEQRLLDDLVSPPRPRRSSAKGFGWESLTGAELAVAALISTGMTNKEAAGQLFVSPHTIDFHLRQLFRKLDVKSRVELTRVVLAHEGETNT
jgi:transcriptional regulator of acetoin/glycerol metabolism